MSERPTVTQIALLAEGRLDPDEAARVRAAIAGNEELLELLDAALAEHREQGELVRSVARGTLLRWVAAAAALAVVAAGLWFAGGGGGGSGPGREELAALALVEELDVIVLRGPLEEGVDAYAARDYARAIELLAAAPDDPLARLYAGSARLLSGDEAGALVEFGAGAAATDDPGLTEAFAWQSAQAHLLLGDAVAARATLEPLVEGGGARADAAGALLAALDGGP